MNNCIQINNRITAKNNIVANMKALAIVLMVLGHCASCIPYLAGFIIMFHMPLFFFVSGYCFKSQYLCEFRVFLTKKLKRLWWPYVKWGGIFLALHNVFFCIHVYNEDVYFNGIHKTIYTLPEFFDRALMIVTKMQGADWFLAGYWFLNALFWGSIISWGFLKLCQKVEFAILLAFVVTLILNHTHWVLPYFQVTAQATGASLIFLIGHYFASHRIPSIGIFLSIGGLILTFITSLFVKSAMNYWFNANSHFVIYLPISILATWSVYSIFAKIKMSASIEKVFSYIGNHTLDVLTFHMLSFILVNLLLIAIFDLPIERLAEYPVINEFADEGWWLLYGIAGVSFPLWGRYIFDKMKVCYISFMDKILDPNRYA